MAGNNHSGFEVHEGTGTAYVPGFWSLNGFKETVWTLMVAAYVQNSGNANVIMIDELQARLRVKMKLFSGRGSKK